MIKIFVCLSISKYNDKKLLFKTKKLLKIKNVKGNKAKRIKFKMFCKIKIKTFIFTITNFKHKNITLTN